MWGSLFAETVYRLGVRSAVIAPGSRSTPLAWALAQHEAIDCIPILDERSAGFFALGLARAQRPALVICTSGTAGANLFPAVIEARESRIPLMLVTADRPPELRYCQSGQTIDQVGLFGRYPVFHQELALPGSDSRSLRHLRQSLVHAWGRAAGPPGGPVHLNFPFREPLTPDDSDGSIAGTVDSLCAGIAPPAQVRITLPEVEDIPFPDEGLIVAGAAQPADPAAWADAIHAVSSALGWPVLADALNPLRFRAEGPGTIVAHYDLILRNSRLAAGLKAKQILQIGPLPTSKILRGWLEATDAPTIVVSGHGDNLDPAHARARIWPVFAEDLPARIRTPRRSVNPDYARRWAAADREAGSALEANLADPGFPFEGCVVRELVRRLPRGSPIFLAGSMPVRDAEYFCEASDRKLRPFCNRGANGIDGTLGTAMGLAHGYGSAFLLCGDLALLHDTNAFLITPELRAALTVVLVNNRGGGIFEHLPVAELGGPFERFFATPQTVDFARLAEAYGVTHQPVVDATALRNALETPHEAGVRILEWCCDRKRDAAFRRKLFHEIAESLTDQT